MNRTTNGYIMGHICTNIAPYDRTPGDECHSPSIEVDNPSLSYSLTDTISKSLSESGRTRSLSKSKTITQTFSSSLTFSKTLSKTFSLSSTFSRTGTFSKSLSQSRSRSHTFSGTFTKTQTETLTRSATITATRTKTKSKSITLKSKTKPLTLSKSVSLTDGSATASFHFFDTCSEGWIRFGRYCFKHFPTTMSLDANVTTPTAMTFADALSFCEQEHGATIVPVQNNAMLLFLQEQVVGENSGRRFWNGVYQDSRFHGLEQTWRTVYNRTGFNDFFLWDTRRLMPQFDDCVVHHVRGNLGARIVGGNDAMVTYPCHGRAEVVCGRLQDPWSVTSINQTDTGSLLAIEGHYLTLSIVGRRLPRMMSVQLQTTSYQTHNGAEGQPTHCVQTKPRNTIPMNGSSTPVVAFNISRVYSFDKFCNGTCDRAILRFPPPETLGLVRGHKYSFCFFFPYDYDVPLSSDEYRWDFLPNLYLEVAQSQRNYQQETCERRSQLIDLLYYDQTATDATRVVPSPWYFNGPLQPDGYWERKGLV